MKQPFEAVIRKTVLLAAAVALSFGVLLPSAGAAQTAATTQENGSGPAAVRENGSGRHSRRGMRMSPDRELSFLSKRLSLSQDQQSKIKPILENQHKQMMDLRNDTSLSRDQKRAKFMDLHKSTMDQIKANLNSDQVTKFEQMQQQREQRMKAWRQQHESGSQNAPPQNPQ
ncbi:MAG: hypothetical protein ACRD1N_11385 [Terriglobia bacterium]